MITVVGLGLIALVLGFALRSGMRVPRAPVPDALAGAPQTVSAPVAPQADYRRPAPAPAPSPPLPVNAGEYLADNTRASGLDHAMKDALMETMHQSAVPAAELLLALFEDRAVDPVVREYAIQHLRLTYERLAQEDQELRTRILDAFVAALTETNGSMPGTALLALNALADTVPQDIAAETVCEWAVALLADESAADRARVTAFSVAARREEARALPIAHAIAFDPARSAPLRIAAIAALGELGSELARAELEDSLDEPNLAPAVRRAVERIEKRRNEA